MVSDVHRKRNRRTHTKRRAPMFHFIRLKGNLDNGYFAQFLQLYNFLIPFFVAFNVLGTLLCAATRECETKNEIHYGQTCLVQSLNGKKEPSRPGWYFPSQPTRSKRALRNSTRDILRIFIVFFLLMVSFLDLGGAALWRVVVEGGASTDHVAWISTTYAASEKVDQHSKEIEQHRSHHPQTTKNLRRFPIALSCCGQPVGDAEALKSSPHH